MPRCELRVTASKSSCKRSLPIFYLHVLPHRARTLLRILQQDRNLKSRSNFIPSDHTYCLYGIRVSLRTNVFLSRNCNYKPSLRYSLYRDNNCPMVVRRIFSRQCHPNSVFCFSLSIPFYYSSIGHNSLSISSQ